MIHYRVKEKLVGLSIVAGPTLSWLYAVYWLVSRGVVNAVQVAVLVGVIIALPCLVGAWVTGYKLLRYETERPIAFEEMKRRIRNISARNRVTIAPMMICLSGIDGSGKTTQLELIAEELRKRGLQYKRVSLRWAAFVSYPLLGVARLIGYTKWKMIRGTTRHATHEFYRNLAVAKLWPWLFSIDMLMRSFVLVSIPLKMGYYVLCDRFVLDAMADLMEEVRDSHFPSALVGRVLFRCVPKESIIVLLDVEEEIAFMRKDDIPSLDYLRARRRYLLLLAQVAPAHQMRILIENVSAQSPIQVHRKIIQGSLSHQPFWYVPCRVRPT